MTAATRANALPILIAASVMMSLAMGMLLELYVVLLSALNFGAVVLQCGMGECHTFGYRLL